MTWHAGCGSPFAMDRDGTRMPKLLACTADDPGLSAAIAGLAPHGVDVAITSPQDVPGAASARCAFGLVPSGVLPPLEARRIVRALRASLSTRPGLVLLAVRPWQRTVPELGDDFDDVLRLGAPGALVKIFDSLGSTRVRTRLGAVLLGPGGLSLDGVLVEFGRGGARVLVRGASVPACGDLVCHRSDGRSVSLRVRLLWRKALCRGCTEVGVRFVNDPGGWNRRLRDLAAWRIESGSYAPTITLHGSLASARPFAEIRPWLAQGGVLDVGDVQSVTPAAVRSLVALGAAQAEPVSLRRLPPALAPHRVQLEHTGRFRIESLIVEARPSLPSALPIAATG